MKKHRIELTETVRKELLTVVRTGECKARAINRAHVLLMSDDGMTDQAIASALHFDVRTVERIRARYFMYGLWSLVNERPRPGARRKLDVNPEAKLVALACSKPPKGHRQWTNDWLTAALVKREIVDTIARSTVYSTLKKTR